MDESTIDLPAGIEAGSTALPDDTPFAGGAASASDGSAGQSSDGIGLSRDSFSGMDTDFGVDNTDNGNGNWFYGDSNQAEGNGNWNYGDGNQTNGNGNWYLARFTDENLPLTEGNSFGFGEGDAPPISLDSINGNNPVFAGGSITPTPVGDGETSDVAENPAGNNNVTTGNGNWYFGESNQTNGNGNWNFGSGSSSNGNANWNLGDNNQVSGNGNRPSGSGNTVSGNSNRIGSNDNSITGNRLDLGEGEDNLTVYGNADRYFVEDEDGSVTLVSDESASDPNYTFDFAGVVNNGSSDALLNGGENGDLGSNGEEIITDIYESLSGTATGSSPGNGDFMGGAAGIYPEGEVPADVPLDVLSVS